MSFAAPWYLLGLIPFAVVSILLLIGQHKQHKVPFLELWQGPATMPRNVRKALRAPPIAIMLALGAILLGLLAAARPLIADNSQSTKANPTTQPQNVGIVTAALRAQPPAQVMVRVRNDSQLARASLSVASVSDPIDLPARGEERNYFIDLDHVDSSVPIVLDVNDDVSMDNKGLLKQTGSWPKVEVRGQIPQEIERVVEVYSKLRPASEASLRVIISPELTSLPSAIVPASGSTFEPLSIQVQQHPITAAVDWNNAAGSSLSIATLPEGDWQTIALAGSHPIIAIRTAPARQVWIGFSSESFRRSSDFVILWTNVLDWISHASAEYVFEGVGALPKPSVESVASARPPAGIELSPGMLLAALGMLFLSVLSMRKANG